MKWSLLLLFLAYLASRSRVDSQDGTTEESDNPTNPTDPPTTTIPILLLSDSTPEVTWSISSTDSVIIEADEGYKIGVNIPECNIDGENGEYATISTDESVDGLMFSYAVRSKPSYLYNTRRLYGNFFGTDASNFTAVFTRIGEELATTTTEIPTTTIILPTPTVNDSDTLLVYLAGRAAGEYVNETLDLLIDAIAGMAVEYCENENFPLNGSITSQNVQIHRLVSCPLSWPHYETCISLTFAIPVYLTDDSDSIWHGYQMTTQHLEIMWSRYSSRYLPDDVTDYSQPDMDQLKWGIVIATGIIVIFVISILVVRYYIIKISKMKRKSEMSDTASIISGSDRNSQISLPPHYLQETPPLFENAYPMYNPEKSPTYAEPTYTKTFNYSDYDDINSEMKESNEHDIDESGA